ncbi:heat shock 70 kDa protein 4-like, partial [Arapaima gigas]
ELISVCSPIVTKPKPKVELPKDEKAEEQNGPVNGQATSEAEPASPDKGVAENGSQSSNATENKLPEMDID